MSKITKGLRKQAKKEKKAVKKAKKRRQKGRYVECSTEVSVCHVVPAGAWWTFQRGSNASARSAIVNEMVLHKLT